MKANPVRFSNWLERRRVLILELKSKPCLDCGNVFPPECMDFDHRDPEEKSGEIWRSR